MATVISQPGTKTQQPPQIERIPFNEDGAHINDCGLESETDRMYRETNARLRSAHKPGVTYISPHTGYQYRSTPQWVDVGPKAPVKFTLAELAAFHVPVSCTRCMGTGMRQWYKRPEKCNACGGTGEVDMTGLKRLLFSGLVRVSTRHDAAQYLTLSVITYGAGQITDDQFDICHAMQSLVGTGLVEGCDGDYRLSASALAARAEVAQ